MDCVLSSFLLVLKYQKLQGLCLVSFPFCVEVSEVTWVVFGELSEVAWVVFCLLFLFLSQCVEVCCQLRAKDSSVAKEVEALRWMVWASSSPPILVGWWLSGLAWARVSCQWWLRWSPIA